MEQRKKGDAEIEKVLTDAGISKEASLFKILILFENIVKDDVSTHIRSKMVWQKK
jgi:hypothetical protein